MHLLPWKLTLIKLFNNQLKHNLYLYDIMLDPNWKSGFENGWMGDLFSTTLTVHYGYIMVILCH